MKIIILNEATAYSPRDKLAKLTEVRLIEMGLSPIIVSNWDELKKRLIEEEEQR